MKVGYETLNEILTQIIPQCATLTIHHHQIGCIPEIQVGSTLKSYLISVVKEKTDRNRYRKSI